MVVVGAAAAAVLAALSALHVYWALGGRRGFGAAIPEVRGVPALDPGPAATALVALLLGAAAAIVALRARLIVAPAAPAWIAGAGTWTIAVVFAGRVVGDFRLFGVFKKVHETRFATLDSRLYTPLCALLAAACVLVSLS